MIEHFPETFDSLREHVRVLKKDGYFLIGVPCKQGLHYPLKILMNLFRVWNIGYEKSFSKKYFQSKLIENGLEIENSFFLPLQESSNQNSFRYFFTKIFSQIDKLTFGTHMQYYLCKKR